MHMDFLPTFHTSFLFNSSVLNRNATELLVQFFKAISDQCFIFTPPENVIFGIFLRRQLFKTYF